jgi:YfiH family protein
VRPLLPAGLPAPALGAFTTRARGAGSPGASVAPYDAWNLGTHVADDDAAVSQNRARLRELPGVAHVVFAEQVHGTRVTVVDAPQDRPVPATDALVTTTPGLALAVLAADCLPVLLVDPAAGVVAAVHAGRAGLAAGVLEETLAAMRRLGAAPATVSAVLGPAACGGCYELPEELADEVGSVVPGARATTRRGTPSVDLVAGALGVLTAAGVTRTAAVGGCTLEQPETFYSYRRDGRTGRHAGLVWLPDGSAGDGA